MKLNVINDVTPHYPSSYPNTHIISLAYIQSDGSRSSFSNWWITSVDFAAPGLGISSTWIGGGYRSISGTSMVLSGMSGGTYRVTGARSGYIFEPGGLIQRVDGNTESRIAAARTTYQVRGVIMNRFDAAGVPGAEIEVFVDGRSANTINANADGSFYTSHPFGAAYRLEVRHPDFYAETVSGNVTGRVSRTVAMLPS